MIGSELKKMERILMKLEEVVEREELEMVVGVIGGEIGKRW